MTGNKRDGHFCPWWSLSTVREKISDSEQSTRFHSSIGQDFQHFNLNTLQNDLIRERIAEVAPLTELKLANR